jgi:hypothetical protein
MSVYSALPAILTIGMQAKIAQALISLQLQPENNQAEWLLWCWHIQRSANSSVVGNLKKLDKSLEHKNGTSKTR